MYTFYFDPTQYWTSDDWIYFYLICLYDYKQDKNWGVGVKSLLALFLLHLLTDQFLYKNYNMNDIAYSVLQASLCPYDKFP